MYVLLNWYLFILDYSIKLMINYLATPAEALNSSLMGFFEKRKFRNFLIFVSAYEKDKPSTFLKGLLNYHYVYSIVSKINV